MDRQHTNSDVVIVGAGPIGLTAALLLADAGVRTTLIDQVAQPTDLPRAISLQDESFRTFDWLGVADALKAESLLDTGTRYFGLDDRLLLEAQPAASRIGHPAKTQFDQPILEQLLWDRAVAHEQLTFLRGTQVVAISNSVDSVTVTIKEQDAATTITADWLIGADGGKSFVRSALGIQLVGTTQTQRWIVVDLLNETRSRDPFAEFHCDGKRPYVLVPGVNGRLRIEFMLFDHEDADEMTTPERIHDLVVPTFRATLDPADVRRSVVYVAHQRVARTYRQGRTFLIGDAAHLMPPFAGQGLNAGVRDATNLSWKLIEAIRGRGTDRLLDSYERERRTHGASMVEVSRRVGAVVMATNPLVTRLRDLTVRAMSLIPSVRDFLANMRFITPADYADGVAVRTTATHPAITVGRALPQPVVRDSGGSTQGLDAHLGSGWALLQVGGSTNVLGQRHPYWRAIAARHIHVLPPRIRPGLDDVSEVTPLFTADLAPSPLFIAVRPDNYVAALFTDADEAHVVTALRRFVDDRAHDTSGARA